jgi:glycosyltransferase involved in cell wall biosynthesis
VTGKQMVGSLHIIGSKQFGGADRFYVRLVRALNECGHTALAVNRPGSPIALALNGVVEQVHVPMRNVWDILSGFTIRRLVRDTHVPIVQTYMGRATRLTRIPRHSQAIHIARLGGYYKIKGRYEHAHAWVGNTRGVCDYLVDQGLPAEQVYRIGNFVEVRPPSTDKALISLRRSLNIPMDAIIVFSLGRFIAIKGMNDLLTAFAYLPREVEGRQPYLIIAGDGPLRAQLCSMADALDLNTRLRWVGWQNDPGPYFNLADVFVCPSRHETLGNVILEAWAYQLPVISTRTLGALELVEDERNAILVPCKDPEALSERLLSLLKVGPAEWRRIAEEGRETLMANHSQEAVVNAYLAMYEDLQKRRSVTGF